MIRIAIATLGCKTNAYESAAIIGQFGAEGHCVVPFADEADIYIINTCTVTGRTDFKSRNLIRKALIRKHENPQVRIVVTGCFAQRNPAEIDRLGAIDLIVDNQYKQDIASLLYKPDYAFADIMDAESYCYRPVGKMVEHSRAFQKIQDGCDRRCAYCAVPSARGPGRSAKFADVLAQARLFVESGYKEIVLGGVNLGLYHDGDKDLADVVLALAQIEGLELIRMSSVEPDCLTERLIGELAGQPKFCHHFHIPLQSGCDSVLQRMGRRYTVSRFRQLISSLLADFPDAAIGLDVIVGFPGETDAEFQETLAFLRDLDIAYLHVFSFSRRPDTTAATMPNQVTRNIVSERSARLTQLSSEKKDAYRQRLIADRIGLKGVCEKVIGGYGTFLSDHYIRGYDQNTLIPGEICHLTPQSLYKDGVR